MKESETDVIETTLRNIRPVDETLYEVAQKHLDNLTKPPGSLGRLEEFARRLVAITKNRNPLLDKKVV
ncbi:MAG TPA: nicotinate-nucleotide--dimethylbenzimidazole phosphoribosyltransferase, partial [Thermodesulfovibrionales bacterium]|nr:nicotinate-nucleotide--dimethylbenzimidazole phosphoribosyltransferase [Thermodesulfovibrionales bacterium]